MIIDTTATPRKALKPRKLRRQRPLLWTSCWLYLAAVAAIWIGMRQLGDQTWTGALLLLGPRWPYALPLLILWPWAAFTGHWRSLALNCAATTVLMFPIMGFRASLPSSEPDRAHLRLLSCNIHRQHLDPARFSQFIADTKPDVVALQGWSDLHKEALFADGQWDVRRDGELLIASRFPLGEVKLLPLADDAGVSAGEQGAAALYEIRLAQGPVHLINLHLASPHAGLNSMWTDKGERLSENIERRRKESVRVRELADSVKGTLLLAGDFNTTTESSIFRETWAGFTDAFLDRGNGLGYTYLNKHTQLRIDHILADSSCEVVRCWTGPDVNAAHRPLVADINFR